MPQWHEEPDQPKLLPGKKPIIQIAGSTILQSFKAVSQPKKSTSASS